MKKFFKIFILFAFIFNTLTTYSIDIKKKYSDKYMIDLHTWLPNTFEELKAINEDELYRSSVPISASTISSISSVLFEFITFLLIKEISSLV